MSEAIVALALMKEAIQPNKGGHRSSGADEGSNPTK
jgi:hypothetical protein